VAPDSSDDDNEVVEFMVLMDHVGTETGEPT
jgi:hypothetical protein